MGPSNYLARGYQAAPIAITVEGANILTRSMIIFGQGAIRGHPYVLKEIAATQEPDHDKALRDFDEAFFGHMAFVASNKARTLWLGLTGARLTFAPGDAHTRRYYQQLTRLSGAFAFASDIAMFVLGGSLKRRERLSARLGDILSQLYLVSAALKRYEDDGRPRDDLPLLHWSIQDALVRIQDAFYGLFENLPGFLLRWSLRFLVFPWGRPFRAPRDRLGHQVVELLLVPGPARDRLTAGVFISSDPDDAVGALESALVAVVAAEPMEARLRTAQRNGTITAKTPEAVMEQGLSRGVLTPADAEAIRRARALRRKAIMVDDFPKDLGKTEIYQTTEPVTFEALKHA
jgi:acyl-CoA dehydrogenase